MQISKEHNRRIRRLFVLAFLSSFGAHAENFVAPASGTLYISCVGGSAGALSQFGTGTSTANFVPYLNSLPRSCPTAEVSVGAVTAGQTVPFGIHTVWDGREYWAFSTGTDEASIVSFTDVYNSLAMAGKILQPTGPNTWVMHLNDAAHYTFSQTEANNILIQLRLSPSVAKATPEDQQGVKAPSSPPLVPASVGGVHTWSSTDPNCTAALGDGHTVRMIRANGIAVLAAIWDNGSKTQAYIGIKNSTSANVDVRPESFQLVVSAPKYRMLAYQDPDQMAKSIRRSAGWKAGLTSGLGGMAQKQTTSTSTTEGTATVSGPGGTASGTYNGTTMTTSSQPDYEARQRAAEKADRIRTEANNAASNLQSTALRANTLLSGQQMIGAVFFEHERHIQQATITVVVGNDSFVIPFERVTSK
jgi:hypothetical protein